MRNPKIGDVYYTKVPNGYKLFQLVWRIPRYGQYIRVFDGLYDSVPCNVAEIVAGPHAYIIPFFVSRAYRIGLAVYVENAPIPQTLVFPQYAMDFWFDSKGCLFSFWFHATEVMIKLGGNNELISIDAASREDLPPEFRSIDLLSPYISPSYLLYLFDNGFNLNNIERWLPKHCFGDDAEKKMQEYEIYVNELLEKDQSKRKSQKTV